jgi:hypothetical protein
MMMVMMERGDRLCPWGPCGPDRDPNGDNDAVDSAPSADPPPATMRVSTQTFIVRSASPLRPDGRSTLRAVNLHQLFDRIELAASTDARDPLIGRQASAAKPIEAQTAQPIRPRSIVAAGAIIAAKYKARIKTRDGSERLEETTAGAKPKLYLNCVSLKIARGGNETGSVDVKVFSNGALQLTGCKSDADAHFSIRIAFDEIERHADAGGGGVDNPRDYYLASAMRNVDFDIGYKLDRGAFIEYIARNEPNVSVPPFTTGFMGVKIKVAMSTMATVRIPLYDRNGALIDSVAYETFYTTTFPNAKKLRKQHYVSVSVFQNGKALMSAIDETVQRAHYDWFMRLVDRCRETAALEVRIPKTFVRGGCGGGGIVGITDATTSTTSSASSAAAVAPSKRRNRSALPLGSLRPRSGPPGDNVVMPGPPGPDRGRKAPSSGGAAKRHATPVYSARMAGKKRRSSASTTTAPPLTARAISSVTCA